MVAEMAVCAARDCTKEFLPNKYTPWHRFCSRDCQMHDLSHSNHEYRERKQKLDRERQREQYWNLSGIEYNKQLLRKRRQHALKRMEERSQRLEVELLG